MGGGAKYDSMSRGIRAESRGFSKAFTDTASVFEQQKVGKAHDSMLSKQAALRESRDSANNPAAFPIILGLDVTGSMGDLPKYLVTEGLPKIMTKLVDAGLDPALLFLAIGDHEYDKYPLQVGQFESSDPELDLWLTRTYLEGGGGGNAGESYLLSWYYAIHHTQTDQWEKRGKKGVLVTVGDEPNLENLPAAAIKGIFSKEGESTTAENLFKLVSEQWEVFHIHVNHGYRKCGDRWKAVLGQHLIEVEDVKQVSDVIVKLVHDNAEVGDTTVVKTTPATTLPTNTSDDVTML